MAGSGAEPLALLGCNCVDGLGNDEVVRVQASDGVGGQGKGGVAPAERDVGMMVFCAGQDGHAFDEGEGLIEVGKGEAAGEAFAVGCDRPVRDGSGELGGAFGVERRRSLAAGDATSLGRGYSLPR